MSAQLPSSPPFDPAADRRRAQRLRAFKQGKIVFNHGYGTFDCTIRNLSDRGAMLTLSETAGVPDHFELRLEAAHPVRHCVVRWRTAEHIGVAFEDP
jgi:hypothetical protein